MDKFAFGENWDWFARNINYQNFLDAQASLQELISDLNGKTFLDVGCGSGLFSIAATVPVQKIRGNPFVFEKVS